MTRRACHHVACMLELVYNRDYPAKISWPYNTSPASSEQPYKIIEHYDPSPQQALHSHGRSVNYKFEPTKPHHRQLNEDSKMCIQIVERYSVCKHEYYRHSIDPCRNPGTHSPTEKTVLVGYACPHCQTNSATIATRPLKGNSVDSGYWSGSQKTPKGKVPKGWA